MTNAIGLVTSILMIVSIGVGNVLDNGNIFLTVLGMYGWAIIAVDSMVNIND